MLGLAAQGSSNAKEYIIEALSNNAHDLLALQLAVAFGILDTETGDDLSVLKTHMGNDEHLDLITKLRAYLQGEEAAISGEIDYARGESEIKNAKLLASEVLQLAGRNKEHSDLRSFYMAPGEGTLLYYEYNIIATQTDNLKDAGLVANLAQHFIEFTENRSGMRIDDIEIAYRGEKMTYAAVERNGIQIQFTNGDLPHSGEQLREEMLSMKEYGRYANNRDSIVLSLTEGELAEFSKNCIASGETEALSILKERRPELFENLSGGILHE